MMDVKPISEERLADIRKYNTFEFHNSGWAVKDIADLLAEVERLRAENAIHLTQRRMMKDEQDVLYKAIELLKMKLRQQTT